MIDANRKNLIVVLGMHRSGTSAITKSLELLGVGLGSNLHPPGFDNPKGFWEDRACIDINNQLLELLGSSYDRLNLAWDTIPANAKVDNLRMLAIQHITRKLIESNGIWGFKDPRTCRLLGFWKEVFLAIECDVGFVIAVRNPASVAASLMARNNIPAEKSYFLWLQHVLPPLNFVKTASHVVVDYDDFLNDPYLQVSRISTKLGLVLPDRKSLITRDFENNFLNSELRHTTFTESALLLDRRAPELVSVAYNLLTRLAKDQELIGDSRTQIELVEVNARLQDYAPAFDYINALEDSSQRLLIAASERDDQVANLNHALAMRDTRISNLNQIVTGLNEQVTNLNEALVDRNDQVSALKQAALSQVSQVHNLNEAVAERDGQMNSLGQIVTELNEQVATLNQAVVDRNDQVSALKQAETTHISQIHKLNETASELKQTLSLIKNSYSWRLSKPLRILSGFFVGNGINRPTIKSLKRAVPLVQRAYLAVTQDHEKLPEGFNKEIYLKLNPDLAESGMDPTIHYLLHGRHEGRTYSLPSTDSFEIDKFESDRPVILVVSHEASRTGAPVLSLNLVQSLVGQYNVVVLLLGNGPLTESFRISGTVVITMQNLRSNQALANLVIEQLCARFAFRFALINSIESRVILPPLAEFFVPTISLVHEFASYTRPRDAFRSTLFWSGEVVFSAQVTMANAFEQYPDLATRVAHILPQGRSLLPDGGLSSEQLLAEKIHLRHLIRPKGLEEDAVIVLGAGFVQLRKGVELFIECAARVRGSSDGKKCRFVWVGKGYDPEHDVNYSVYLADQIRRAGLEDDIVFIEETPVIETAYEEADLLLLSSRLDPLPNVAIDAIAHGVPVVCFDKTTGIADFLTSAGVQDHCVAGYLDSSDLAQKVLALAVSPSLRGSVADQCQEAAAAYFSMKNYVSSLDQLAQVLVGRTEQEKADTLTILDSGLFRPDFACPIAQRSDPLQSQVRTYVRAWASGIDRRKPLPGFHPGVYLGQHGVAKSGADPFADFIREGQPDGEWCYPVIAAGTFHESNGATNLRIALHLHVYYPELLSEILIRLALNKICPDIFISMANEHARQSIVSALNGYQGRVVDIQVVPNRGRDIGPLLTAFGPKLVNEYDLIGHIHTKMSADVKDAAMGKTWYRFILENLLGGESGSMADSILAKMNSDKSIGMVFPDDPYVVGMCANHVFADDIAARIGLSKLPEHFLFPVGTMFWARTSALAPFVNLDLGWDDYPEEPLPYDGTLLHALERLFSLSLESSHLKVMTTNVVGLTR